MNETLDLILARYRRYAVNDPSPPAGPEELEQVRKDVLQLTGVEPDPDYLYLAGRADGIGADGTRVYATAPRMLQYPGGGPPRPQKWIVEENRAWRRTGGPGSPINDWLIYGTGELEYIIHHLPTRTFQLRPRGAWDRVIVACPTFAQVLWEAFRYPLQLDEVDEVQPR